MSLAPLQRWTETLLGFLYPNVCQICEKERAGKPEGYICSACRSHPGAIQFIAPPFCDTCGMPFPGAITTEFDCFNCADQVWSFRKARAAVRFKGLVRDVIHKYKYQGKVWFEPFLGDLLWRQAASAVIAENYHLIAPIPLHKKKERQREFNQAERMAQYLSHRSGIPLVTDLLRRDLPTLTQTRLTRAERQENVRQAFGFSGKTPLRGEKILLVDDVLTTGATANACAKVLRQNGAAEVDVWTVARGLME